MNLPRSSILLLLTGMALISLVMATVESKGKIN